MSVFAFIKSPENFRDVFLILLRYWHIFYVAFSWLMSIAWECILTLSVMWNWAHVSVGRVQRVRHAGGGRLLLRTPGPVPLWGLHVFWCRDRSLLCLSCLWTFEFWTPLGTSLLLVCAQNILEHLIEYSRRNACLSIVSDSDMQFQRWYELISEKANKARKLKHHFFSIRYLREI